MLPSNFPIFALERKRCVRSVAVKALCVGGGRGYNTVEYGMSVQSAGSVFVRKDVDGR